MCIGKPDRDISLSFAGFIPQNPSIIQPPPSLLMPLARAGQQLAQGKDPDEVLHILANTLTNRLIHPPCAGLREATAQGDLAMLNLMKNLYRLDGRNPCR